MEVNHSRLLEPQSDACISSQHDVDDETGHQGLPKDHVRLVRVLPGRSESLVHCETRIFSLPMSSGYTAISYAWGPPVAEHAIILNGREHLVAKNLWHFLTTWRSFCGKRADEQRRDDFQSITFADGPHPSDEGYSDEVNSAEKSSDQKSSDKKSFPAQESWWKPCHYWLWIDALSIDQNNKQERGQQVKIMSHIFGGADEVLVWLGLPSTAEDRELEMNSFIRAVNSASGGPSAFSTSWVSYFWKSFEEICDRIYWTRLWVFQELRSAKQTSLMCGNEIVHCAQLAKILTDTFPDGPEDEARRARPNRMRQAAAARMLELCGQNTPSSLWLLLQVTQHLDCYDPRDKVYALLSMAKSGADGIEADYEMPLPGLMNLVLRNLYSTSQPPSAGDVAVRCARLKAMMGLERDFPWGADDYLAAEKLARASTEST